MSIQTNDFCYVASGNTYLRLGYPEVEQVQNKETFHSWFRHLNGRHSHDFSLLYNAWTECDLGVRLKGHFAESYSYTQADSGGLQIVTQGKECTDQIRDDVYRHQAINADYGMCFDEIPVKFSGQSSSRTDFSNRWFDKENLVHLAKLTGKNITRQIDLFLEGKSECKPVVILHGNSYDTFLQWYEGVLSEIAPSKRKYIGAIAMSGASIGTGILEDIERAFVFSQIKADYNHLHLLGLGSVKRLMPFIIFKQTGILDGVKISYDSTTHTSAPHFGRYYLDADEGSIIFNRKMSKEYERIYADIQSKRDMGVDLPTFFEVLNTPARKYPVIDTVFKVYAAFVCSCIDNFMHDVEEKVQDKKLNKKLDLTLATLYSVKTQDDMNHWFRNIGLRYVKSNRVRDTKPNTLDELF